MGLTVKNLQVSITKDNWDAVNGNLTLVIPVREIKLEAVKMGLVPNEDGEIFANINYQHSASGFRFTYRSSIAVGEEIDQSKVDEKSKLLAQIKELQDLLKGKK